MWTALLLQLSVQLAWCQETLDGSNGSSHQPACDDQTAMLQFQVDSTFFGQKRNDEHNYEEAVQLQVQPPQSPSTSAP
eukprot:g17569.t1